MKHHLLASLAAFGLAFTSAATALADDLESLLGTWSVKKTNEQDQAFFQVIEVRKDKFIFKLTGLDDTVFIYAEGDLKLEKAGPFKMVRFVNIKGGQSATDLQPVEEEFASIYVLGENTWTTASNFDRERPQPPGIEVYKRVKLDEPKTLVIDKIVMDETPQPATWYVCLEVTVEGTTRKYNVAGKGYDKTPVTIPLDLNFPKVKPGQKATFTCKLDDVDEDVCTEAVDQRSTGGFAASASGSESYKPQANWRYSIHWHLK